MHYPSGFARKTWIDITTAADGFKFVQPLSHSPFILGGIPSVFKGYFKVKSSFKKSSQGKKNKAKQIYSNYHVLRKHGMCTKLRIENKKQRAKWSRKR